MSELFRTGNDENGVDEAAVAADIATLAHAQRAANTNRERAEQPQFTPGQMLAALVEICLAAKVSPAKVPTLARVALSCGFKELEDAAGAYARLVKLLGADGEVADHGRGAGTEFVPLAQIGDELAALRESLEPFERLRGESTRRAAA